MCVMAQQQTFSPQHDHRVLRTTSGNARMFERDSKPFDLIKPLQRSRSVTTRRYSPYPKSVFSFKSESLSSNQPAHLENESYRDYLTRKRQDRGTDGKPIWPAEIEESFQDALRFIPPIGKNKKCHGGKPNGRNELIAKWIEIDTGQRRGRKQISSHIQNLTKKFTTRVQTELGDVVEIVDPEWDALIKPNVDAIHDEEYYWESLEDKVRLVKQLKNQAKLQLNQGYVWDDLKCQQHTISRICFSMWIGQLPDMSETLHDYTRISNELNTLPTLSLDDITSWQTRFPDLSNIVDTSCDAPFEIVLFKSRMAPMSSFPPATAKLGLRFDLDFGQTADPASSIYQSWHSLTHFYKKGQRLSEPKWRSCNVGGSGIIQPGFEVEWWATQFTDLVQHRKAAEATSDESVIATAVEQSRDVFRSLTIMQEIYASPSPENTPGCLRKRMGILLWTFGQVHKGHIPLTVWHKIEIKGQVDSKYVPNTDVLQATASDLHVNKMMNIWSPNQEHALPEFEPDDEASFSPSILELNPFSTGLTPLQSNVLNNGMFDANTTLDFGPEDFQQMENILPVLPMSRVRPQYSLIPEPIPLALQLPSNDFANVHPAEPFLHPEQDQHFLHPSSPDRQQSLANFDVSTHAMLQTQLGPDEESPPEHDASLSHTTTQTESQQSVTGHIAGLDLHAHNLVDDLLHFDEDDMVIVEPHHDLERIALDHPAGFDAPKVVRPPLMTHNTFAGFSRTHSTNENELGMDSPMRLDFEKLINNDYENATLDNLTHEAEFTTSSHIHYGNELVRPHSQPPLSTHDFDWETIELPTEDGLPLVGIRVEDISC